MCCAGTVFIEVLRTCSSALLDMCSPALSGCASEDAQRCCVSASFHIWMTVDYCTGVRANAKSSFCLTHVILRQTVIKLLHNLYALTVIPNGEHAFSPYAQTTFPMMGNRRGEKCSTPFVSS